MYCHEKESEERFPTTDIFGDSFLIRQCNYCEAYYLDPHPSNDQLGRAYGATYYGEGEQKFSGLIQEAMDFFPKRRARQITKAMGNKGKVLDIGCGNGHFLEMMKAQGGVEIYGIEMPGNSADRASKIPGINLKIGSLQDDDYQASMFDAITMFHVFEHLHNPQEMLQRISKLLRPGGVLYISVPNIDSWQARWFKGKWLHLDPPRHLFFFTPKRFTALLGEMGFSKEKEKHFNIKYNPYGMQQSMLNKIYPERELLFEHLKGNKEYTKNYSALHINVLSLLFKLTFPLFIAADMVEGLTKKGATVEFLFRKK